MKATSAQPTLERGKYFLIVLLSSLTLFAVSTITTIKFLTKSKTVVTPDLTNKSVESARSICRVNRLKIEIKEYRFDERIPANVILEQTPLPKESVKSGRTIKLMVSRGSRSVKVPNVAGQLLRQATMMIEKAGLHLGRITRLYDPFIPKNQVMDQWPTPELAITHGAKINLLLSDGPEPFWFILPNFTRTHIDQSAWTLEKLGLHLSEIKRKIDNTQPTGTIIAQTPPVNSRVKSGMPAGLIATKRTDNLEVVSRFVTINFHVPASRREVRVKMLVSDDSGLHEIYNAMEKPDTDLTVRRTLSGTTARLKVYVNGQLTKEESI